MKLFQQDEREVQAANNADRKNGRHPRRRAAGGGILIGYVLLGFAAAGGALYALGGRVMSTNVAAMALRLVREKRISEGRRLTSAELQAIAEYMTPKVGRSITAAWLATVSEMVERELAGGPKTRAPRVAPPRAARIVRSV